MLHSLWVHGVVYSGEFLTKTTAATSASSQGVVERRSYFFEKNKVLGVESNRVLNILEGI